MYEDTMNIDMVSLLFAVIISSKDLPIVGIRLYMDYRLVILLPLGHGEPHLAGVQSETTCIWIMPFESTQMALYFVQISPL